jgi:hypothetical protein
MKRDQRRLAGHVTRTTAKALRSPRTQLTFVIEPCAQSFPISRLGVWRAARIGLQAQDAHQEAGKDGLDTPFIQL